MNSAKLNDWMQVIGIFAVVVSLIFVGLQMQQEQKIAIVDTYGSVAEAKMNLSVLVGQNMAVWRKGLDDEELTEDERGIFEGLAVAVLSHYQRNFIRWLRLGPGNPNDVASEIAYSLYIFPGFRKFYESNKIFSYAIDAARGSEDELAIWPASILHYLEKYDEEMVPIPDTRVYIFWAF